MSERAGPAAGAEPGTAGRDPRWKRARVRWAAFRRALAARGSAELLALLLPFLEIYRKILLPAAIVLVMVVISLVYRESILEDLVQQVANRWEAPAGERIVVVAIDDETLSAIAPETDSRGVVLALVARIAGARPRAIGVDYVFLPPLATANPDQRSRPGKGARGPAFPRVAGSVPVVAGSIAVKTGELWTDVAPDPALVDPLAQDWGHAYVAQSKDAGQIRTIPMDYPGDRERPIPSLSLALWAVGRGMSGHALREALQRCDLAAEAPEAARECPADLRERRGEKRIRFGPAHEMFTVVSAARLLDGRFREGHVYHARMAGVLRDRHVLLGATHRQGTDRFATPLVTRIPLLGASVSLFGHEPLLPGVFVHGYALQNLLRGDFIRAGPSSRSIVLLALSAALPLLTALLTFVRRWLLAADGEPRRRRVDILWVLGVSAATCVGLFAYAIWVLRHRLEAVPLGLCIPVALATMLLCLLARHYAARVEEGQYRELLARHASRYLPGSESRYHQLIGTRSRAVAIAVHRPFQSYGETPAALEQSLRTLQRRLTELIDPPPPEGLLPIVDNWGFNRVGLHLHCVDGDREREQRQAGLRLVLPRLIQLAEHAGGEGLGQVRIAVAWGDLLVIDVASPCERGVLTVTGELLDDLVRLTEPRADGGALVVLSNLADEEPLVRTLAQGYAVERRDDGTGLLAVRRA